MNNEAENHEGWIQDPDGNWHPKPEEKAIGKLGQAVIAVVIVAVALIVCLFLWNRAVGGGTSGKSADDVRACINANINNGTNRDCT